MTTIRSHRKHARARATANGTSYQAELNAIARENGHVSWGSFARRLTALEASGPAPAPTEDAEPTRRATDVPEGMGTIFRRLDADDAPVFVDWNMPEGHRPEEWRGGPFMPTYNVLAPEFLPDGEDAVENHAERIAEILVPDHPRGIEYFTQRGRGALVGFLLTEIALARRDDRIPSIPAMIDWINAGLREASDANDAMRAEAASEGVWRNDARDALSTWLLGVVDARSDDGHARIRTEILPLVDMAPNERSGVLGTMDRGLLPFRNAAVRRATA